MPTERFMRLRDAKKQMIREAAVQEFARVPFDKVSINQIIQTAGISRGSFYTYFEDKQDLLEYVFSDGNLQMKELCEKHLEESGGDFFDLLEFLFEYLVGQLDSMKNMMEISRNVFSYQENAKMLWKPGWGGADMDEEEEVPVYWVWNRIDRRPLKTETPEDFISVLNMGIMAVMFAVRWYYEHPERLSEAKRRFAVMLEMMKYGAVRAG